MGNQGNLELIEYDMAAIEALSEDENVQEEEKTIQHVEPKSKDDDSSDDAEYIKNYKKNSVKCNNIVHYMFIFFIAINMLMVFVPEKTKTETLVENPDNTMQKLMHDITYYLKSPYNYATEIDEAINELRILLVHPTMSTIAKQYTEDGKLLPKVQSTIQSIANYCDRTTNSFLLERLVGVLNDYAVLNHDYTIEKKTFVKLISECEDNENIIRQVFRLLMTQANSRNGKFYEGIYKDLAKYLNSGSNFGYIIDTIQFYTKMIAENKLPKSESASVCRVLTYTNFTSLPLGIKAEFCNVHRYAQCVEIGKSKLQDASYCYRSQ